MECSEEEFLETAGKKTDASVREMTLLMFSSWGFLLLSCSTQILFISSFSIRKMPSAMPQTVPRLRVALQACRITSPERCGSTQPTNLGIFGNSYSSSESTQVPTPEPVPPARLCSCTKQLTQSSCSTTFFSSFSRSSLTLGPCTWQPYAQLFPLPSSLTRLSCELQPQLPFLARHLLTTLGSMSTSMALATEPSQKNCERSAWCAGEALVASSCMELKKACPIWLPHCPI